MGRGVMVAVRVFQLGPPWWRRRKERMFPRTQLCIPPYSRQASEERRTHRSGRIWWDRRIVKMTGILTPQSPQVKFLFLRAIVGVGVPFRAGGKPQHQPATFSLKHQRGLSPSSARLASYREGEKI